MNNFLHIIITEFNLRRDWKNDKNGQVVRNEAWMQKRMKLFTNFCFPSIENQTIKDFFWLVYFDTETETKYRNAIDGLRGRGKFFVPKYVDGHDGFQRSFKEDIRSLFHEGTRHVITTDIDNDDCFNIRAVERIQACFNGQAFEVVNFHNGICLQIEPKVRIARMYNSSSPFISVISEIDQAGCFKDIRDEEHQNWEKKFPIHQITDDQYWLQVIHGSNMMNTFRGRPVRSLGILKKFSVDPAKIDAASYQFGREMVKYLLSGVYRKTIGRLRASQLN